LFENIVKIRGALHQLEQGEKIATRGADAIDGAKRDAIAAIEHAEHQFFSVSEDLTVTDRLPPIFGAPLALVRQLLTAQLQADIRSKALLLVQTDQNVADQLIGVSAALREFDLEGGKGGPSPGGEPTITGPAGPLKQDDDQADLNATLPGSDITISGDGRNGYPTLNGQKNPLEIEGNTPGNDAIRPLPTGTIVGPDGKQYALYSEVPYKLPNGQDNPEYATPTPRWSISPIRPRPSGCFPASRRPAAPMIQRPIAWSSSGTPGRTRVTARECCICPIPSIRPTRTAG
jgi:hypothetical protein